MEFALKFFDRPTCWIVEHSRYRVDSGSPCIFFKGWRESGQSTECTEKNPKSNLRRMAATNTFRNKRKRKRKEKKTKKKNREENKERESVCLCLETRWLTLSLLYTLLFFFSFKANLLWGLTLMFAFAESRECNHRVNIRCSRCDWPRSNKRTGSRKSRMVPFQRGRSYPQKKTAAEWPSQLSNDLAKIYYLYFTTRVIKLLTWYFIKTWNK